MFSYFTGDRSGTNSRKNQKNNHQNGGLFRAAKKVLYVAAMCLLLNTSVTNVVN